jgi:hypothetical protein
MQSRQDIEKSVMIAKACGFVPILLKGKVPVRPGWQKETLATAGTFKSAKPGINVGVLTGKPSNIIVLDIEHYELSNWEEEVKKHGKFPVTLTVRTGGGGRHIYFNYTKEVEDLRNAVKRPYDLKTSGGQCVFLYSRTELEYIPIAGFEEDDETITITIANMPRWLIEKFRSQLKK